MADLAERRLFTQRLAGPPFESATGAVGWFGAVQSQDYTGAKWALGMRTRGLTSAKLDRLYDAGTILRTHVMRPTWHFVLPTDIRWMLELTASRVKAAMAFYSRQLEIDSALLKRTHRVVERSLRDGNHLTRRELGVALTRAGIQVDGQRLGHVTFHAELDALIASGPLRGRSHTYALLDERAPGGRRLGREEALAELTRRYFTSHGPAQQADFAWWSGLTLTDARKGLELVGSELQRETFDGKTYWSSPGAPLPTRHKPFVHLLPNYDEFLVAYRDRSASHDPARSPHSAPVADGGILGHSVIVDGQFWGAWKRRANDRRAEVELGALGPLDARESAALRRAMKRFERFMGAQVDGAGLD